MNWRRAGLTLVILFFFAGGLAHFAFATAEIGIIPPYVPYPHVVNYASGFFELLGAIGLMIPTARKWAGLGLILLTICVTPANVFMLQHAGRFPDIPVWVLAVRLPLQVLLILLIGWSSSIPVRRVA
jgi:uncharacterized membrane protein